MEILKILLEHWFAAMVFMCILFAGLEDLIRAWRCRDDDGNRDDDGDA